MFIQYLLDIAIVIFYLDPLRHICWSFLLEQPTKNIFWPRNSVVVWNRFRFCYGAKGHWSNFWPTLGVMYHLPCGSRNSSAKNQSEPPETPHSALTNIWLSRLSRTCMYIYIYIETITASYSGCFVYGQVLGGRHWSSWALSCMKGKITRTHIMEETCKVDATLDDMVICGMSTTSQLTGWGGPAGQLQVFKWYTVYFMNLYNIL